MNRLEANLGEIKLKNPIIPASGCAGFGKELAEIYDLSLLGGIALKTTTREPRLGNPMPRVAEVPSGMLNAIGLINPGIEAVVEEELPFLMDKDLVVLASAGGSDFDEYIEVTEKLDNDPSVDIIELNISCPNVKKGCHQFGTNSELAFKLVSKLKEFLKKPLYVKLSPNASNIVEIAKAVERAGADGIVMINTLTGMQIDLKTRKPLLANKTGGMSGPAIKPLAIRMIYEVYEAVSIPIIGCGGITSAEDVIEFMLAGATAVEVGYANFVNPTAAIDIIKDLPKVMDRLKIENLKDIIGGAH